VDCAVDGEGTVYLVLNTLGVEGADDLVRVCRGFIEDYPTYSGVFFSWVGVADGEVAEALDIA